MKWIVVMGCLLVARFALHAQSDDPIYFKHYSAADGLSQNSVNCILKNKDASLWIGTDDGLNHFNGHEFVVYENKINDPRSLSHNNVLSLDRDSLDNLWIGTAGGLNKYNPDTDDFTVFTDSTTSNYFPDLLMDQKRGRIWLATEDLGLKYFDLATETIKLFHHASLDKVRPSALAFDRTGLLWVGTLDNGVFKLNPESLEIMSIDASHPDAEVHLSNNAIHSLVAQDDNVWIASEGGLNQFNSKSNAVTVFSVKSNSLKSDLVWSLAIDPIGTLWVGTDGGGLSIRDGISGKFETHLYSKENPEGVSGNTLRSIYVDDDGSAWLGTYNNGLNYFNQASRSFHHFAKSKPCSALAEMPDGTILVGTDAEGLFQFDEKRESLTPFGGILCKKILAVLRDHEGGLWMGTFKEGLHYKKGETYHIYRNKPGDSTSLKDDMIWGIVEDAEGNIFLGTETGLSRFNRKTGKFEDYLNRFEFKFGFLNSRVHSMLIDSKNRLWMGTSSYVGYVGLSNGALHQYSYRPGDTNSIPNSLVLCLLEKDGYVWGGTFGGGLIRINPETNQVVVFNEESGLPNTSVVSLEKDRNGNLWMGTNKGIVKFHESPGKFSVFGSEVGVLSKTFYAGSSLFTTAGAMIFGGNNGFSVFNPNQVVDYSQRIMARITGEVDMGHVTKPRPARLDKGGKFKVEYSDSRFLGFTVSAFHYLAPEDETYAYRLVGLENEWMNIGKQRNLVFTNLDPGNYTLEVKAGLNNQWSENIARLPISILTPWWMSLYVRGSILIALGLGVVLYTKLRTRAYRKRQRELELVVLEKTKEIQSQTDELTTQNEELTSQNEQIGQQERRLNEINSTLEQTVEKRTSQLREAYRELDIFFYRASHDFRRPLTTFMGLGEVAKLAVKDPFALDLFSKVTDTAKNLDKMVNKLQSVSEVGSTDLVIQTIFLETEITRVYDAFKEDLQTKDIKFHSNVRIQNTISSHRGLVWIILSNLIENSIQFATPENPYIKIEVFEEGGYVEIQIEDNGEGIPLDLQERVFEMYFRASERSKGNGLGLYIVRKSLERLNGTIQLTSKAGQGTFISVRLPIDGFAHAHITP